MKLSVVIPSYNSQAWLPHAVASIFGLPGNKNLQGQTHKDLELIIVNDGSTDNTFQYLEWLSAQHSRDVLKIVNLGQNKGRSAARNLGNDVATGELILVLDADDIAAPNRAALTIKKYQESKADFLYGSASIIDGQGDVIGTLRAGPFNRELAIKEMTNRIVHSTVAYTKDFAKKYPYRGQQIPEIDRLGIDDWDLAIRASFGGAKMDFVPQTISAYRAIMSGISAGRDEDAAHAAKLKILEEMKEPVSI